METDYVAKYLTLFSQAQLLNLVNRCKIMPIDKWWRIPMTNDIIGIIEDSDIETSDAEDETFYIRSEKGSFSERANLKSRDKISMGRAVKIHIVFDTRNKQKGARFKKKSFILFEYEYENDDERYGLALEQLVDFRGGQDKKTSSELNKKLAKMEKCVIDFRVCNYNEAVRRHFKFLRRDKYRDQRCELKKHFEDGLTLTLDSFREKATVFGDTRLNWNDGGDFKKDVFSALQYWKDDIVEKKGELGSGSLYTLKPTDEKFLAKLTKKNVVSSSYSKKTKKAVPSLNKRTPREKRPAKRVKFSGQQAKKRKSSK
ncbi:unnamed protein product [Oikopleura dioica]|uniref:Uncharacterized protein n=1 Tax=Oikopleura dioica TaxID=34765 RepID=E4XUY0_OIKDI|nr:unnamed protein product [Oikopleura dioica]